jgi:hypothetical protein
LIQSLESRRYLSVTFANFAQPRSIASLSGDWSVVQTANFGNGNNDIAAMGTFGTGQPGAIAVLMNDGKGNFTLNQTITTGDNPTDMVIADINQDGQPDLVVVTEDKNVEVYLATGAGTFSTTPQTFGVGTGLVNTPCTLTVVDLALNSTVPSIVVNDPSDNRAIIYTASNGQLESLETFNASLPAGFVFERPSSTQPMDLIFSGPAIGSQQAGSYVAIIQQMDNSIVFPTDLTADLSVTGNSVFNVPANDLITNIIPDTFNSVPGVVMTFQPSDGNGESTIVCANLEPGLSLQSFRNFPVRSGLAATAAADINGDGANDLIIGNDVFLNNGADAFTAQNQSLPLSGEINHSAVVADFTGDGLADIISSLQLIAQNTGTVVNTPGEINANIISSSLLSIFVPGDRGTVKVQLVNNTGAAVKGKVNLQVLSSATGQTIDAAALLQPARYSAFPVSIAQGKSITLNVPFTIPGTIFPSVPEGVQSLLLETTAVSGIDPSVLTLTQTVPTQRELEYGFGTVGTRHNLRFSTTVNNARVTFSATGAVRGSLAIFNNGAVLLIADGKGSVNIAGPAGLVTSDVSTDGLTAFHAPGMNFNGGSIDCAGPTKSITLGDMTGSAITVESSSTTPINITAGIISNTFVRSSAPIGTLSVRSFVNTNAAQTLIAPSLARFIDAGNLEANIAIASSIGILQVADDITSSTILAGATFGMNNTLGGGDDTFAAGSITRLTIGGSLNTSLIGAGLSSNDDQFPIANNVMLLAGSKIGSITIRGILNASRILSIAEPARVSIDRAIVTIDPTDPRFNVIAG